MSNLTKIITSISWDPESGIDSRAESILSDSTKIRIDPSDYNIKLKLQSDFRYPTDSNLNIRSYEVNPEAIHNLLMIQIISETPDDTSINLRIFDGSNEMYWDGGSWSIAGASDWNTETEINQNISTLDVKTNQKFAIVLNLVTTDNTVTPSVSEVLFLWEGQIDWNQNILLDSLTQTFQEEINYVTDMALPPLESDLSSIDLNDYTEESDLNITGIEAVFDHTSDSDHFTDILTSYDVNTKIITLNTTVSTGNVVYLRLEISPEVVWDTNQDYQEIAKLPQVILSDVETLESNRYSLSWRPGIIRKDTGEGYEIPSAYKNTYQITAEVRTDRSRDQLRILDSLMKLLSNGPSTENGPFLRNRLIDEKYRIQLLNEIRAIKPVFSDANIRVFVIDFKVLDVSLFLESAFAAYAVQKFNLGFNKIAAEKEIEAIINETPIPKSDLENFEIE